MYQETLLEVFGFAKLRPQQTPVVEAILSGRDVFAVLPTGGGKSLCFQLPGLFSKKTVFVISPLLALINDQVASLRNKHIAALALTSELSKQELAVALKKAAAQEYTFIYCSPEKLQSQDVQTLLKTIEPTLIVIDEAHCISQWGHDFRPAYCQISHSLSVLTQKPQIVALTATATRQTQDDCIRQLNLKNPKIFTHSPEKNNLSYQHVLCRTRTEKLIVLLRLLKLHQSQQGIVYCSTRKSVKLLHQQLTQLDISTCYFHAKLSPEKKAQQMQYFSSQKYPIMISTTAFGMGVDLPHIRWIIHYQIPGTIEQYVQEVGRAGRDGKPSATYVLAHKTDEKIQRGFIDGLSESRKQIQTAKFERFLRLIQECHCTRATINEYFGFKTSPCKTHCSACLPEQLPPIYRFSTQAQRELLKQAYNYCARRRLSIPKPLICLAVAAREHATKLHALPGHRGSWGLQIERMLQYLN